MKKIILTEAQQKLVEDYKTEKVLLESIENTKGGYLVRSLIREGQTITGEYRSVYGSWTTTEWDSNGAPVAYNSVYDRLIRSLDIPAED